jgi:hypothetical protein
MANSAFDWSTTAASNGASDSAVPFPEGMNPSQVNDSARALMGRVAELLCDLTGVTAGGAGASNTTGTANTYALTTVAGWASYRAGLFCACTFNVANTGASTINVNATGAKALTNRDGGALIAGQIAVGTLALLFADGTGWRALNVSSPTDLGLPAWVGGGTTGQTLIGGSPPAWNSTLYVDTVGGKVGVGNTGPSFPLDVGVNARFGGAGGNSVSPTSANTNVILYYANSTNWSGIGSVTTGDMYFVTGSTSPATRMVIQVNSGNVGIGTTSPGNPLTVAGAIQSTSGGFVFPDSTTQTTAAVTSAVKAWVNFTGSSGAILKSSNVASVTRNGVGDYTVTFTNAMADANYGVAMQTRVASGTADAEMRDYSTPDKTTSHYRFIVVQAGVGQVDPTSLTVQFLD